ncbi:MAG: hypothetical protein GC161_00600 [Planctomycetaceae bacterium]|nr:hypothetical protein [Planctomycetaceae bacterium]
MVLAVVGFASMWLSAAWEGGREGPQDLRFVVRILNAHQVSLERQDLARAQSLLGGPLRLAAALVSLCAGWVLARRLRGPGPGRCALAAGLALAVFAAIDPGLWVFLMERQPANALHYQDGRHQTFCLGAALFALAVVLEPPRRRAARRLAAQAATPAPPRRNPTRQLVAAGLVTAAVAQLLHTVVLDGLPLTNDGAAYRFQAHLFAGGRAALPWSPLHSFFEARQIWPGSAEVPRVFAKYPPGHALALAAGEWFGFARLFVLLGAASLPALVYALGRALNLPRPLLAAWLTALSPALLAVFATELAFGTSVPLAFAFLAAGAAAIARSKEHRPAIGFALLAGVALGCVGLTRPGTAFALGLAFAAASVTAGPRTLVRVLAPTVAAALPFAVVLLLFQRATTGDPWLDGYRLYARALSPDDTWGLANAPRALGTTAFNLSRLSTWLFGIGLGLVPVVLGVGSARGWGRVLLVGAPLALLAFYSLLTFHGVPWAGPVYLLESFGTLALAGAAGFDRLAAVLGPYLLRLVFVTSLIAVAFVLGWQFHAATDAVAQKHAPQLAAQREGIEEGIVFVHLPTAADRRRVPLPPPLGGERLVFALDLGERNAELRRALGNPSAWSFDPATGTFTRLP